MKRGTPRHPKVIALAEQLGIEVYAAAGLLELLWHFTAEFSPGGDIGRHSNTAIAKALHWRKKPDSLIHGLVAAKWIDLEEPHRLVVHDWRDHADDATHMKLARARKYFWDGGVPNIGRLPQKDRALAEEFYKQKDEHAVRTLCAFDAHSGEGLAKAKASLEVRGSAEGDLFERSFLDELDRRGVTLRQAEPEFCERILGIARQQGDAEKGAAVFSKIMHSPRFKDKTEKYVIAAFSGEMGVDAA